MKSVKDISADKVTCELGKGEGGEGMVVTKTKRDESEK